MYDNKLVSWLEPTKIKPWTVILFPQVPVRIPTGPVICHPDGRKYRVMNGTRPSASTLFVTELGMSSVKLVWLLMIPYQILLTMWRHTIRLAKFRSTSSVGMLFAISSNVMSTDNIDVHVRGSAISDEILVSQRTCVMCRNITIWYKIRTHGSYVMCIGIFFIWKVL